MKNPFDKSVLMMRAVGLIMVLCLPAFWLYTSNKDKDLITTTGIVQEFKLIGRSRWPVVTFTGQDQIQYTATSSVASSDSYIGFGSHLIINEPGQEVPVHYQPDNPMDMYAGDRSYTVLILFSLIGLILLIARPLPNDGTRDKRKS